MNSYATDGKCHNANYGTYGHECGEPATWIGTKASGFQSGFCNRCKADGDEARGMVSWRKVETVPWVETDTETAYGRTARMQRSIRVF